MTKLYTIGMRSFRVRGQHVKHKKVSLFRCSWQERLSLELVEPSAGAVRRFFRFSFLFFFSFFLLFCLSLSSKLSSRAEYNKAALSYCDLTHN